MVFFGYQPVKPYVLTSVANAKGEIVRTTPIDIPRPVMMHDFAITARHTVLLDFPVVFSFDRLLKGLPVFGFEPDNGARIGVLPRHGKPDEIKWFKVEPCYAFHVLNAHDDGEEVVLHACRMKEFPKQLEPPERIPAERRKSMAVLYRWRLNLKTGQVKEQPLDDVPADFPRIDDAHTGQVVRHGYTMRLAMDGFIKYDLKTGTSQTHLLGKRRFGGEGVFVRLPGGKGEDDGWLVSYVHDEGAGKSEMTIVDCRDFTAAPVARILLPQRVPYGFHGTWLTAAQLKQPQGS
jgi:carotenoid cleavage dioxygenase